MQLPPSDEQLRRERGEPAPTRRHGDWIFPEGSSGPCAEHTAGRWLSADEARAVYAHYLELSRHGGESPFWYGKNYSFWVDLHARRAPAAPLQPQPRESAQLVTA